MESSRLRHRMNTKTKMLNRDAQLEHWLKTHLNLPADAIAPASADASFRRYFRLTNSGISYILMDAPPDKEDCRPFVAIARQLRAHNIHVPDIVHTDFDHGFLLLSDLGDRQFLQVVNEDNSDTLYKLAIDSLLAIQQVEASELPIYSEQLLRDELALFTDWFLNVECRLTLSSEALQSWKLLCDQLVKRALNQPKVFVHRDYHSRNLMFDASDTLGILDFQDAVKGPATYDLVSLLKDCYIRWPEKQVHAWASYYFERSKLHNNFEQFITDMDWMGLQRHLKAIGIFARLNHRDNKPNYLLDIPRTLKYIRETCDKYPKLSPLNQLLDTLPNPY